MISAAVWGSIFVVSVGLLGYVTIVDMQTSRQAVIDRREDETRLAARQLAEQQANLARLQRLTDQSPLSEWQPFIGKGNELEQQAVERVRKLAHRQDDAEAMLRDGNSFPLFHIRQLDLHATPAFCASANAFLIRNANEHRPAPPDRVYVVARSSLIPTCRRCNGWLANTAICSGSDFRHGRRRACLSAGTGTRKISRGTGAAASGLASLHGRRRCIARAADRRVHGGYRWRRRRGGPCGRAVLSRRRVS